MTEGDFSVGRIDVRKTPFPWFGGKADASPAVWAALGDVDNYVEPFAGSLAGYDTEHAELESLGWTAVEWFRAGFLKGGMGQLGNNDVDEDTGVKHQQHRERLWLSPHCLRPAVEAPRQGSLFGGAR